MSVASTRGPSDRSRSRAGLPPTEQVVAPSKRGCLEQGTTGDQWDSPITSSCPRTSADGSRARQSRRTRASPFPTVRRVEPGVTPTDIRREGTSQRQSK
jgi:hypothetical protein